MVANVVNPSQLIALDEKEVEGNEGLKRSLGRITMWSLTGEVTVEALTNALKAIGSSAIPPEAPSAIVALHRAVEAVAKTSKGRAHQIARGHWAIANRAAKLDGVAVDGEDPVEPSTDGAVPPAPESSPEAKAARTLTYNVNATAKLADDGETVVVEGEGAALIHAAYKAARGSLAPADIGDWLTAKAAALGGVALRHRGGVYFVPADRIKPWLNIQAALKACSGHRVHTIPSMRTADAVEAILAAITADTKAACDKIAEELSSGIGKRALAAREKQTADLLARVERYEGLLGTKLDELRTAMSETEKSIAAAVLASEATDGDAE